MHKLVQQVFSVTYVADTICLRNIFWLECVRGRSEARGEFEDARLKSRWSKSIRFERNRRKCEMKVKRISRMKRNVKCEFRVCEE